MRRELLAAGFLFLAAGAAAAQGLVIPDEPDLPPLALQRHAVRVEIDAQGARTTVEQVFVNNTERRLEAQYLFPIPKGAVLSQFVMTADGKEKKGEIVEKEKARQIYAQLVNRAQDPALLECLGSEVFRAALFPMAPKATQVVTLRYDQVLPAENSLISYLYPVRNATKRGATVQGEYSVEVVIKSPVAIKNVYSPSHSVNVVRPNENEARVSYSTRKVTLEKNFQLYYSVSDKDLGFNLLTFRPNPKDPGAFMMLISPKSAVQTEKIVDRDVIFVIDTSGSMAGEKFKQAQKALKYCVGRLNDGDRFNIIRFSSDVEPWKKELASAREHREAALAWADTLLAQGGTDIAGALDAALSYPRDPARPYFVVFMTDGKPTVGETTDPTKIMAKVDKARAAANGDSMRIFTWGVGYDVDTHLLDGIADTGNGISEYVHPDEDIEAKVSAFYNKASRPILTNLDLQVIGDKIQLVNMYPRTLPDLYAGGQLILFGQYTGEGDVALRLTGRVNNESRTLTFEGKFPGSEATHAFIQPLWAKRRIGYLLDTIRRQGETKEMMEDVVRLSMEYGIQTPYTSYLIRDDGSKVSAAPASKGDSVMEKKRQEALSKLAHAPAPEPSAAQDKEEADRHNEKAKDLAAGFRERGGKAAVATADYLRRLKEADSEGGESKQTAPFQKAGGVRFFEYGGMWVDERFEADCAVTTVKFGSAAYFKLIEKRPELTEVFKIGASLVTVTAPGKALVITCSGDEDLSDDKVTELFAAKK